MGNAILVSEKSNTKWASYKRMQRQEQKMKRLNDKERQRKHCQQNLTTCKFSLLIDAVTVANARRASFDLFNFASLTNSFMLLKTFFSTEFGANFIFVFLVFGVSRLIKSDMIAARFKQETKKM
jgi:hypothetical protein